MELSFKLNFLVFQNLHYTFKLTFIYLCVFMYTYYVRFRLVNLSVTVYPQILNWTFKRICDAQTYCLVDSWWDLKHRLLLSSMSNSCQSPYPYVLIWHAEILHLFIYTCLRTKFCEIWISAVIILGLRFRSVTDWAVLSRCIVLDGSLQTLSEF